MAEREKPSFSRRTSRHRRVTDEADGESATAKLALAQTHLSRATAAANHAQFGESEREATAGLEAIAEVANSGGRKAAVQQCRLFSIRGKCRAKRYDVDGDIRSLALGLEDLQAAAGLAVDCEGAERQLDIKSDLAIALVRCGEQFNNVDLLREAISLLAELLEGVSAKVASPELYILVNARGVAQLRLGAMSGDRALVEKACRDLQDFLRRPGLDREARSQTVRNVLAALTENARQNRSERVYRRLIELLDKQIADGMPDHAYFLHYRATARLELARLTGASSMAQAAINDIHRSLEFLAEEPGRRITVLHSLAQAHFRLAGQHDPRAHYAKAIRCLDEALHLAGTSTAGADGRVTRLLADRAAYHHALGVVGKDARCLAAAERDFEIALARFAPETAPSLYAQIAAGLFLLRYRQSQWEAALQTFAVMERAWSIIVADPFLSSEVHAQRTVELAGHYARAALCYIRRGVPGEAAAVVDRGRAQQLTVALSLNNADLRDLSSDMRAKVDDAARTWERVRRIGRDRECRDAWQQYLDLRRNAGLDNTMPSSDAEGLVQAVPVGGALVQVFGIDAWGAAIVVQRVEPRFVVVELPQAATQSVSALLHGDKSGEPSAWRASYDRFNSDGDGDVDRERARFEQWTDTIQSCMNELGATVMEPIHDQLRASGLKPGAPVLVSPPGELAALPLNTAQLSDGSCFSDHWSVSMVPNTAFVVPDPPEAQSVAVHSLLAVSEPDDSLSEDNILPFAAREAQLIGARFPADRRRHIRGSDANVETVIAELGQASVVHVACHGVYDWQRPGRSGIELARGKRLTISRLKSAPESLARTRLIVLSCCETGIAGQTLPPDEFVGLLPAFLQCGIRASIGTLWAVYDDAAMLFCDRFYRSFLDRSGRQACSPATALVRAQDWLRRVTLGELVDEGLIVADEGVELAKARFRRTCLRVRRASSRSRRKAEGNASSKADMLPSHLRTVRPYSSPVDWAAYVVVGL